MDKSEFYLLKLLKRFWQERERKARTTSLMATPEDQSAKFHKMTNAKEIWEVIKSRFGGNDESKKMQKYLLKQQFKSFSVSNSDGLHKGYDRTKPGVDTLNFDDVYNNLRVFEYDVKGSTRSSSSTQNVAFVSSDNTSSTNEVNIAYGVSTSFGYNSQTEGSSSYNDDLIAKGNQDSRRRDAGNTGYKARDNGKRSAKQDKHKAMVTIHGEGVDWTVHAEDDTANYALMAFNSSNSGSDTEINAKDKFGHGFGSQIHDGVLSYENEVFESVFDNSSSDLEDSPVNDRFTKVKGMHVVPPPVTGNYMPPKSTWNYMPPKFDFGIDESKFTYGSKQSTTGESDAKTSDLDSYESSSSEETLKTMPKPIECKSKVVNKPKVWTDATIIEEFESNSNEEHVTIPLKEQEKPSFAFVNIVEHVTHPKQTTKEQNTCSQNPKPKKSDWNGLMSKRIGLGYGFTKKACFVCGSFSHLIRDCDFHKKIMVKKVQKIHSHNGNHKWYQSLVLSMLDVKEEEHADIEEVLEVVKAAKLMTKVVTTAGAIKVSVPRKRRGVIIQDPEETTTTVQPKVQAKDKGKAILIEEPKPLKMKVQIELDEEHYNYNQAFLDEVNEGVKVSKTEVRQEKDVEVESSKREDATPLALKIPIVDYKIHTERNRPYFKIIRADGNHMLFINLSTMLKNFNREDLESLWNIMRDRFEKTKPKNYSYDYFLNTLKIMLKKPNVEASIWKNQKGRYGLAKILLLVKRMYPLTHFTLEQMLNDVRLQVEDESEMSLELLRLKLDIIIDDIKFKGRLLGIIDFHKLLLLVQHCLAITLNRLERSIHIKGTTSETDENTTNPKQVPPTPQAPHTLLTIKLPILKKGEYDIWAMKMEHYLEHTDYPIWEVIQKGNGHVKVLTDTNRQIRVLPPKTAKEILARKRERKARTALLMAIPEDHLVAMISTRLKKFYKKIRRKLHFDAKEPAVFDKGKLSASIAIIYDTLLESADQNGIKTVEGEMKEKLDTRQGTIERDMQNRMNIKLWLLLMENVLIGLVMLKMAFNSSNSGSDTEKWLAEAKKEKEEVKTKLENFQSSSKGLSKLLNSQMNAKDKSGLGYGSQIHDGVLSYENEVFESLFDSSSSDIEDSHVNDRFAKVKGMHAVPSPVTGSSKETLKTVHKPIEFKPKVVNEPKVWTDAPIIEEYESDINAARQNFTSQAASTRTARKVNTARPKVNEIKPRHNVYQTHSPIRRSFNKTTTPIANFAQHKVNTVGDKSVSVVGGKWETAIKASAENIVPSGGLACLIAKAIVDESTKWDRRMTIPVLLVTKESNTRPPPITAENKANKTTCPKETNNSAGTQDSFNAGNSKIEADHAQEYYINEDTDSKINEEPIDQEDQAFLEQLKRLKRQEKEANDAAETLRKILEDIYEVSRDGIFTSASYDDEGAVVDFTNLETTMNSMVCSIFTFLVQSGYRRGFIDKTLFIKKDKKDIMPVQVYVDDIIFGSTKKSWCDEFETLMKKRFQMSSMGKLTFFLRLQVKQKEDGIFIGHDKYVTEVLKKFDFLNVKTASTPIETKKPLVKNEEAIDVDVNLYRSMIGSLIYLTTIRPDIIYAICACLKFQVTPKTSHLQAVKRIFRYLKGQQKLGLWYPRESDFDLEAYSDNDYAGANLNRKSTTGGCQFLGRRLTSWQCKNQTIVATSTTEA
uniref:Uncharacterized mitochondrial protein AtMg00810-like n=1 Tax=Tanacetum cinerariifolium TaxID=118510 RepID=A0A6L2J6X1_TANCI|nr:uncharacterized mitochondrial protein AtMg00810-like [Tanacetum cinerariifolium]